MSPEKKKKIKNLKAAIGKLTEDEKIDLVVKAGGIVTCEGRTLSQCNTILMLMQTEGTGQIPTVVGGYRQWQKAGRQVRRGEHGMMIWFPVTRKTEEEQEPEDDEDVRFFIGTVFDISQTEEKAA